MSPRQYFVHSMPGFVVDPHSVMLNSGRQVDWTKVGPEYSEGGFVVTAPAGAAAAATSIVVTALPGAVKAGTILNFTGTGEAAIVTTDAAAGATSIAVEALDAAIEAADTAPVAGTGKKRLRAGTPVAEDATSGKVFPRDATNPATGLLATDAQEADTSAALSGFGVIVGGAIYQNLLPGGTPAGAIKTELNTNGYAWVWETYADDRAT
jgi:hypothetical protein